MFRTTQIQKNLLILIGILTLSYVIILLVSPKDIADYTVADTAYWGETKNRVLLKTAYDYNYNGKSLDFPANLGEWKSSDFKYSDEVYSILKADILLSREYSFGGNIVWMDIINSKVGGSFHNQRYCLEGIWQIDNESIAEFRISNPPNPDMKLYANRLDISRKNQSQVMLYWFMFKRFGQSDAITMIRLTSPVVNNKAETFDIMKTFVEGELFEAMYERAKPENITIAEYMIRKYGTAGVAAIVLGLLAPTGLVLAGLRRKN